LPPAAALDRIDHVCEIQPWRLDRRRFFPDLLLPLHARRPLGRRRCTAQDTGDGSMAKNYFRWIKVDSADLAAIIKESTLQYTDNRRPSNKAFFVFDLTRPYRPSSRVVSGRVLVGIELTPAGQRILDAAKRCDFEDPDFDGEAGHPTEVIVKKNEEGALGIGKDVLAQLQTKMKKAWIAEKKEVAKALELREIEDQVTKQMAIQKKAKKDLSKSA
jgi:hypothetical protein